MKKQIELSEPEESDQHLFERHAQGCTILKQNKIRLNPKQLASSINIDTHSKDNSLIDFHFENKELSIVHADSQLIYKNSSLSKKTFRNLQKGQYNVAATLDLHGHTEFEAKVVLYSFLTDCLSKKIRCCRIIHGKGNLVSAPILKNCLNQWLRQLPFILAFCSTPTRDGGTGALYALLKSHYDPNQEI